jgi:hypothetical protein
MIWTRTTCNKLSIELQSLSNEDENNDCFPDLPFELDKVAVMHWRMHCRAGLIQFFRHYTWDQLCDCKEEAEARVKGASNYFDLCGDEARANERWTAPVGTERGNFNPPQIAAIVDSPEDTPGTERPTLEEPIIDVVAEVFTVSVPEKMPTADPVEAEPTSANTPEAEADVAEAFDTNESSPDAAQEVTKPTLPEIPEPTSTEIPEPSTPEIETQ